MHINLKKRKKFSTQHLTDFEQLEQTKVNNLNIDSSKFFFLTLLKLN